MRKLIHGNFEINLSNYKITDTEENPWFLDEIPLKFTFPFEIDLDDETDINFGFISSYQTSPETLYPLIFQNNDQMEEAELELEDLNGRKLTATFTYGLEQLPSWDKKLSELPLDNFDLVSETIYEHAKDVISQTWPDVNYNFPQIHIDTIDTSEELWAAFKARINDYNGVEFPENYVEEETYLPMNVNIIQPLPYALHILQKGLEMANLVLEGEILEDERLTKKCIYTPKEYFAKRDNPEFSFFIYNTEYEYKYATDNPRYPIGYYTSELSISSGRFNILGVITITGRLYDDDPSTYYNILFDGVVVASGGDGDASIDVEVLNITTIPKEITVICVSRVRMINPSADPYFEDESFVVVDLQVLPLELFDAEGNSIPTVINENKVDLTNAVADITFGEYFKQILNWYNYDYEIDNGIITMNKVENQINYENAINLSDFEVREPGRRFRKGYSYLLKFQDADNEFGYTFEKVFQSSAGVFTSDFKENDKTSTIEINALPLPLIDRKGSLTAHAFETNESKIYAVIYDGLTDGKNLAKDPTPIFLPSVHSSNWFKWFSFRINAQEFRWPFKAWAEQLIGLKAKGKAFAYGRYHVIKKIQKTETQPDLFDVDIELESME